MNNNVKTYGVNPDGGIWQTRTDGMLGKEPGKDIKYEHILYLPREYANILVDMNEEDIWNEFKKAYAVDGSIALDSKLVKTIALRWGLGSLQAGSQAGKMVTGLAGFVVGTTLSFFKSYFWSRARKTEYIDIEKIKYLLRWTSKEDICIKLWSKSKERGFGYETGFQYCIWNRNDAIVQPNEKNEGIFITSSNKLYKEAMSEYLERTVQSLVYSKPKIVSN